VKIKEEPVSDITFPISEELEGDLASGDQSLPVGVLGAQSERFSANLEVEASPQTSGRGFLLLLETVLSAVLCDLVSIFNSRSQCEEGEGEKIFMF